MKKLWRKALSIILTLLIIFSAMSSSLVAFADNTVLAEYINELGNTAAQTATATELLTHLTRHGSTGI